jgi:hypothetical protein
MPLPRKPKGPSKASIKAAADRAEGLDAERDYDPLHPETILAPDDIIEEMEELEPIEGVELPKRPYRRSRAGRPTKYKPEYARVAKALLKAGHTVPELAEVFDISVSTVWLWRSTHPEFMQAFSESNEFCDRRAEASLYQRVTGYDYPDTKVFNNNGTPLIVPIWKHIPPDPQAARFWLQARQNDRWRVPEEVKVTSEAEAFLSIWQGLGGKKNKEKE